MWGFEIFFLNFWWKSLLRRLTSNQRRISPQREDQPALLIEEFFFWAHPFRHDEAWQHLIIYLALHQCPSVSNWPRFIQATLFIHAHQGSHLGNMIAEFILMANHIRGPLIDVIDGIAAHPDDGYIIFRWCNAFRYPETHVISTCLAAKFFDQHMASQVKRLLQALEHLTILLADLDHGQSLVRFTPSGHS